MENNNKIKCSFKKHDSIDAINFCQECCIYMCNKCQNHHSELFEHHHLYNLDKNIKDIFTGFCKEKKHNKELNYFCKNHNILCCAVCLCKIEDNGYGLHKNCDVCTLNEIDKEKRDKLKQNIKLLEDININIEKSIGEIKMMIDNCNKSKEKLIISVQEAFTKLRNNLNKREDELLLEIDKKYKDIISDEKMEKQSEKLPKKIKELIEKGKLIEKEWNNNSLNSIINDCISIENNIKSIKNLSDNLNKYKEMENNQLFFKLDDNDLKDIVDMIKSFGALSDNSIYKFKFKEGINYTLSNNGLIATKTSGGDSWNCSIIGDKKIPKNKISKWKIRINNFQIKNNTWNILIGIGPKNKKNEGNFYNYCWTFICGQSKLSIKSGNETNYNDHNGKLNQGDIIEVTADRIKGDLSFSVNNINYGLTNIKIPNNEELYPIVLINDENQCVEIV